MIFYTHHFDLGIHDRFYLTYTSFKKENIDGQLSKLLPELIKAIECYNMLYPTMKIEWSETPNSEKVNKRLLNNTSLIHFNRVINGESYAYSQMDILSLNNKVVSAGLTSHVLILEESQELSYDWVSKQALPFLGSTSGIVLSIGTANSDPESCLYRYYKTDNIPPENKVIYTWEEIYKLKKLISQKHADKYKKLVESEIAEKGLHSTLIQTEWYCNFNLTNDKFTSIENLIENNILVGELEPNISHYIEKNVYRCGAFDGAIKGDRSSFSMGTTLYIDGEFRTQLKECEVIKEAGVNANPDDLIAKVARLCLSNKLDFLIVDNTANMEYLTIYLYKELKKQDIKTQLVCFAFSGAREKVKMFSFVESMLFNQNYTMPRYEEREHSIGYAYTLKELCELKRHKTRRGEYTYKAIEGANFYDDFAMTGAMLPYCMKFVLDCIENNKTMDIGRIQYRLYLKKWTDELKKEPNYSSTWLKIR